MVYQVYQTSVPNGQGNENYQIVLNPNLQNLENQLAQMNLGANQNYINVFGNNTQGVSVGLMINKQDPTKQAQYQNFTPANQKLSVDQYTYTTPDDGLPYYQCQLASVTNGFPYLIGGFCIQQTHIENYYYAVAQS